MPRHRSAPQAIDTISGTAALRLVAVYEAAKGVLVLAAGLGLLSLLHRDVAAAAERLIEHLHLNPARHSARVILQAASHLTDAKLWALAAAAIIYATVRLAEAYGLWNRRTWAEWFALLSGAMYLPWELYEVLERATRLRLTLLAINAAIVVYLLAIRLRALRRAQLPKTAP